MKSVLVMGECVSIYWIVYKIGEWKSKIKCFSGGMEFQPVFQVHT